MITIGTQTEKALETNRTGLTLLESHFENRALHDLSSGKEDS